MKSNAPMIHKVHAREILDSRGTPTVEVEVTLTTGSCGRAAVPSGASTGMHEALEIRDSMVGFKALGQMGDPRTRFQGKGVLKAVHNVNQIIGPHLLGRTPFDQVAIDQLLNQLDGTPNKKNLGANAILAVSLAVAKAAAQELKLPLYRYIGGVNARVLPRPLVNILNGGSHSDAPIDIQEFMIVPVGAESFSHAIQTCAEVFYALKSLLKTQELSTSVGDEGGFAPDVASNEAALDLIVKAVKDAGYRLEKDIMLALDVAASEMYDVSKKKYLFNKSDQSIRTSEEMIGWYVDLKKKYPIVSIEDGLDQNDWEGWVQMTQQLGATTQLVGDDLFVTNTEFLSKGIEQKAANSILIKMNQIGTLTETLDAVSMAQKAGFKTIISHRSGETEDTTLADLAVATNSGQIKTGSMSRTDRLCKYNQLLRIEEELGKAAIFR